MSTKLSHRITELTQTFKLNYQAKIDLGKLLIYKIPAKTLQLILEFLSIIFLLVIILSIAGGAFILWYGANYNEYLEGSILVIMFLSLLCLDFFFLRPEF